jgi:hypothetical protein
MLRAHCPIRTVEEEQQKQFREAKPCSVPDTTFARAVDRSPRGCFALLKFTDHIQVVYLRGSTGKVEVYFDKGQGTLMIHRRWLDFACMHNRSFCRPWSPINLADTMHRFSVAMWWKSSWFYHLHPCSMHIRGSTRRNEIHAAGWTATAIPPHNIQLKPYPGGILVSWEDNETESFRTPGPSGPDYNVVLHDDKCANAEMALHDKAGKWSLIIQGTTLTPLVQPSLTTWCHVAAASNSLARHTECASLPVCLTHRHIMP